MDSPAFAVICGGAVVLKKRVKMFVGIAGSTRPAHQRFSGPRRSGILEGGGLGVWWGSISPKGVVTDSWGGSAGTKLSWLFQ